jgi:3-dehydroquinate synthase
MVMAAELSRRLGSGRCRLCARLQALCRTRRPAGAGPGAGCQRQRRPVSGADAVDKKAEAGEIRFVLIDGRASAVLRSAPDALVREVIDACCAPAWC